MDNLNISQEEPNGFFNQSHIEDSEKPNGLFLGSEVGSEWEPTNNLIHSHSHKQPKSPSHGVGFSENRTTATEAGGSDETGKSLSAGSGSSLLFDGVEIRPIPGADGYFVSAYGAVFTNRPRGKAITGRLKPLKTHKNDDGYFQFCAHHAGKAKIVRVNRAVALAWVGPAPDGALCCHRNGIRDDNYFENLRWDTATGNEADKAIHGTRLLGEAHHRAKLTSADVKRIRSAKKNGGRFWGASQIANELGVTLSTIKAVASGRIWSEEV